MKVYFLNFTFLIQFLAPSFKELGFEIGFNTPHNIEIEGLKKDLEQFKPDIVFRTILFNLPLGEKYNSLISWCREKGMKTVFWNIEDPNHYKSFIKQVKGMEWIFTTAEECIPLYREEGLENIGVIPLAVEPKFLYPEKKEKIYDIVLIANHYPNQPDRVVDFNHIVKPLIEKDYPLKIWGHKDNWLKAGVPDKFLLGYDNRLREIYNQSKIVLGLNEQRFSPTMTSMRPYEVLGCKAFHLSAWSVAMENIFKDKEHLVLSRSPYETIELVDYYLTREEERDKIAESGYNHVINNHTYKHRVKKMLDYLGIGVK